MSMLRQLYITDRQNIIQFILKGAKSDWDFRISDLVKNPDGTDIQPLW